MNYQAISEKSQSVKVTYCIIPITWHSRKGNTMETIKRLVVAWCWGDRMNKTQIFFRAGKLFRIEQNGRYMLLFICQNRQNIQYRVKPKVNYGLWVMCQCTFIDCNQWTTLVGTLSVRKAVQVQGQRLYAKSVLSTQFCCAPITALKIKSML